MHKLEERIIGSIMNNAECSSSQTRCLCNMLLYSNKQQNILGSFPFLGEGMKCLNQMVQWELEAAAGIGSVS